MHHSRIIKAGRDIKDEPRGLLPVCPGSKTGRLESGNSHSVKNAGAFLENVQKP